MSACGAETVGHCDVFSPPYYASETRWSHYCVHVDGDGHDGPHECGCGHQWTEPDGA